ncbi:putative ubiquinone biosynthesis monooxygenase [Cladochytrium tenue]|nr:putative ubiquinone biosynthesis monooxygenase [Cladochytrium tenue]
MTRAAAPLLLATIAAARRSPQATAAMAAAARVARPRRGLAAVAGAAAAAAEAPDSLIADVCIVGGGIVGTALAARLATRSATSALRVALVESGDLRGEPPRTPGRFANRVSSVTPESVRLLEEVGAWQRIPSDRKWAFSAMEVHDADGFGRFGLDASSSRSSPSALGWIVENAWIRRALAEIVDEAAASVKILDRSSVVGVQLDRNSWPTVTLDGGRRVSARLLVGADGAESSVRKAASIGSWGWNYPQRGLVATLDVDVDSAAGNMTAFQRFLPWGPIAFLPALNPTDFVALVNAAARNPLVDVEFLVQQAESAVAAATAAAAASDTPPPKDVSMAVDAAGEASWGLSRSSRATPSYRPPTVTGVDEGSRASFPLRFRMADRFTAERVALIGYGIARS